MTSLSLAPYRHAVHPGRIIECSGIKVTPLRSLGERSRSRKDFVLNASSSRARIATCSLKTPPYGGKPKEKINPRDLFTFSYRFNTDIPMGETPGASIDEYLKNSPRIVGAVFPDKRKRTKLSDAKHVVNKENLKLFSDFRRVESPAPPHPVPLPVSVSGDRHPLRLQVRREGLPAPRPRPRHQPPPHGSDGLQAEGTGQQRHAVAPRADGARHAVPAAGGQEEPQGARRDERRLQPPAGARAGTGRHHPRRRRHGAEAAGGADEA